MSEWIKCSDRLPEDLQRVDLLVNKERRLVDCTYTMNAFWYHGFPKEYWTEITNNVTHWQPLPAPPEEI